MKMAYAEQHVRGSHGLQEAKAFSIRTNAHAFKLLSSGLYSDKIGAVLREIGCNAFDAHVEAGHPDLPIEVKLPNRIDNQFYIRDWGPGLSHTDVMELYTTYFASTKQSSNDFTGAFGLGSKSPFSYVDSFTVVSVHGGKKRTYSAHLSNEGSPTIALLTTEDADSDWRTGVSVGFPVKPNDYMEFQRKAQDIFQWFRVLPKVEGAAAIHAPELTQDQPLFLRAKGMGDVHVLMGNVLYPLAMEKVSGMSAAGKQMFVFSGLVLRLDIGDVQVAANREALQYDVATSKFLAARCDKISRIIVEDVARTVRSFVKADDWDTKCKMPGKISEWSRSENYGYVDWRQMFAAAGIPDADALSNQMTERHAVLPAVCGTAAKFRILTPSGRHSRMVEHKTVESGKINGAHDARIFYDERTAVYHGRAPHAIARARTVVRDGQLQQLVLVTPRLGGGTEADVDREVAALAAAFKGIPTFKIDTLPIPPGVSRKGIKRTTITAATPVPSVSTGHIDDEGDRTSRDISLLRGRDQHFMCNMANHSMWSHKAVRLYEKNAGADKSWSFNEWKEIWTTFVRLQKLVGLPHTKVMAFPTATQIKQLDLVKRGWRSTHEVIREWVHSKDVRDKVAASAAQWRPTVPIGGTIRTWLEALVYLRDKHRPEYDSIARVLADSPLDLETAMTEIHDASRRVGNAAGQAKSSAVLAYEKLAAVFAPPPLTQIGGRTYTTPDALNAQMIAKHPMLDEFGPHKLIDIAKSNPGKLPDFAKLLFST